MGQRFSLIGLITVSKLLIRELEFPAVISPASMTMAFLAKMVTKQLSQRGWDYI